jgi:hypothetical protein
LSGVTTGQLEIQAFKSLIFDNIKWSSALFMTDIALTKTEEAGGRVN